MFRYLLQCLSELILLPLGHCYSLGTRPFARERGRVWHTLTFELSPGWNHR